MKSTNLFFVAIALGLFAKTAYGEMTTAEKRARKLYLKLTGTVLTEENPLRAQILALGEAGNFMGAADLITDKYTGSRFVYDTVVRNIAITMNRNHGATVDFNDMAALFLCLVRDERDYKLFATADFKCYDPTLAGTGNQYNETNNTHYTFLDQNRSLRDTLQPVTLPTGDLGIFYTRAFALDAYSAGTNRRPWKWIVENLYLSKQEAIKTLVIPSGYVRQDPPRFGPDGSSAVFQTSCLGCHAQMDPISFKFGMVDAPATQLVRRTSFVEKINENHAIGYRPTSTDGPLYYTDAQQPIFGFRDIPASGDDPGISFSNLGNGLHAAMLPDLKSFARVIGYSTGLARGFVTRFVSYLYLGKAWSLPNLTDSDLEKLKNESQTIDRLTDSLIAHKNLRRTLQEVAVEYLDY